MFAPWACGSFACYHSLVFGFVDPKACDLMARLSIELGHLNASFREVNRQHLDEKCRQASDRLSVDIESKDPRQVASAVKGLFPSKSKPAIRLCDEQGRQATTYSQERRIFFEHFGRTLSAEHVDFADVVVADRILLQRALVRLSSGSSFPLQLEIVPSLLELARKFQHLRFSAVGEDCIGPEVFKAAPFVLASVCVSPYYLQRGHPRSFRRPNERGTDP